MLDKQQCDKKSNGYCSVHHNGKVGEDGFCHVGRAHAKQGKTCVGNCGKALLETNGLRLHPVLVEAFKAKTVARPMISLTIAPLFQALKPDTAACGACAEKIANGINMGTTTGRIRVGEHTYPVFVQAAQAKQLREQLKAGPIGIARKIAAGEQLLIGKRKRIGSLNLSECAIRTNAPWLCQCGEEYFDGSKLTPIIGKDRVANKLVFGIGPSCTEAIKAADPNFPFAPGTFAEVLFRVLNPYAKPAPQPFTPRVITGGPAQAAPPPRTEQPKAAKSNAWDEANKLAGTRDYSSLERPGRKGPNKPGSASKKISSEEHKQRMENEAKAKLQAAQQPKAEGKKGQQNGKNKQRKTG